MRNSISEIYKSIVELDKAEEGDIFKKRRNLVMSLVLVFFLIMCLILAIVSLANQDMKSFWTYFGIMISLSLSLFSLVWTNSTGTAVIIAGYTALIVFSLSFYFNTYTTSDGGLDALWFWMLLIPFLADYFGGLIPGVQVSLGFFAMSVYYMWIIPEHFEEYGKDVLTFYPLIFFVTLLVAWILQFEIVYNHKKELMTEETEKQLQAERLRSLETQLMVYEENMSLMTRYQHDHRHYIRVLRQMLSEGDVSKTLEYLKELYGNLDSVTSMTYCDNRLINGILSIYHNRLKKINCNMKIRAGIPEELSITDVDLSTLISNILENAAEAQDKVPEEDRFLDLKIDYSSGKLKGQVRNACSRGIVFNDEGLPESTKEIKSGIGTRNIRQIAEKYGGTVGFEENDGVFCTRFILAC